MTLCNCATCYCASQVGGRKAAPCLFCESGEHGTPREANRIRLCRACGLVTAALDEWPVSCLDCGVAFGPITLGYDRVSSREAGSPLTTATDFVRAIKATRRERKRNVS